MKRRGAFTWALVAAFVLVPLLEIYLIIQVGQVIGAWWTLGLLIVDSIIGSWLVRREGRRAWTALRDALSSGRMPARELADGALILIGGTLMLTPGFVSDVVGMLAIVPLTRPIARRALTRVVTRHLVRQPGVPGGWSGPARTEHRPGPPAGGPVIQGEVIEDP